MATNTRSVETTRLTREQTSHAAMEMENPYSGDWAPAPFGSAPPPRDGYEQRWVRVRLGGNDDAQNFLKRTQQGWVPRPFDSVPQGFSVLKQTLDARFGDHGNVISNQDSVLMERPIAMGNKVRAYLSGQNQRLRASIADFVGSQMPRQHGTRGGSVDELDITSTTGNGRVPRIAD